MLAISFEFTANRYHATQWGRHVNEGVLEWPPSPWRILRAIVATWRRTLPDVPRERVVPILEALASQRPAYHLPPASASHTRHYMPYNEGARERTTLVLDSFVAIQPSKPVFAIWRDVELEDQQRRDDLAAILRNMPYLGRAESWVDAAICESPPTCNSFPMENGALPEGDIETVRTLVPRNSIGIEDLMVETGDLRRSGRIDPESAQWWLYTRKADCFTKFRTQRRQTASSGQGTRVVRFALSGSALPMVKDTLQWGNLARRSAMSRFGRRNNGANSSTLSGKDESGKPLTYHQHAFYLPTDDDGDGKLDHLTIWIPKGLTEAEFRAVVSVDELNLGGGRDPIRLAYLSHGSVDDLARVSPLFEESKRWRSLTPYVPTRHTKYRGPRDENGRKRRVDTPEDQIEREVELRQWREGARKLVSVRLAGGLQEPIAPMAERRSRGVRPIDFRRYSRGGGSNGGGAYNFAIKFDQPVRGPVALGFACHYGLGLFVPTS